MTHTDGYVLINKPYGWTSFDCVSYIKRKYTLKKLCHAGTLYPIATGILLIMIGKATKYFDHFQKNIKAYDATLLLGAEFDSGDITGKLKEFSPPDFPPIKEVVLKALNNFIGETTQVPPQHSALKIKGKSAYKYAREGIDIKMTPRKVFIDKIDLLKYEFPHITFRIFCKKGFYVRSLCMDIAEKLHTKGVMTALSRIKQSGHSIEETRGLKDLPEDIEECILPLPVG